MAEIETQNLQKATSDASSISSTLSNVEKHEKIENEKFISMDTMNDLVKHANISLQQFLDPKLDADKHIPLKLLCSAKGVLFLTIVNEDNKNNGKGIIMIQNNEQLEGWSAPIAVSLNGINKSTFDDAVGCINDIEHCKNNKKIYCFIIANDENILKKFIINEKKFRFDGNSTVLIGPFGKDNDVSLPSNNEKYVTMVSYAINGKNQQLQVPLTDEELSILDEYNKQYFNKDNIVYKKIVNGDLKPPFNDDYMALCKLLNEYTRLQSVSFKNMLTKEKKL